MDRLYGNGRKFASFSLNLSHCIPCVYLRMCVFIRCLCIHVCVCLQASVYLRVHIYHLFGYIYHLCDNSFILLYDTKINNTCICYQMSYLVLTNNGDDKLDIHSGYICITVDGISSPTREALNMESFH